jgi:hypothetical protein
MTDIQLLIISLFLAGISGSLYGILRELKTMNSKK